MNSWNLSNIANVFEFLETIEHRNFYEFLETIEHRNIQ